MPAKVIYIAGVPASGKSTLLKALRERLFVGYTTFKYKSLRGIVSSDGRYKMLGVFDGSITEGTDRLSMSVINDAIEYINTEKEKPQKCIIFAEGDRLFNYRFLASVGAHLLLIDADEQILAQRHKSRCDGQNATFLKSRRSKVENFAKKYGVNRIMNNTLQDQQRIINYLLKTAEDYLN